MNARVGKAGADESHGRERANDVAHGSEPQDEYRQPGTTGLNRLTQWWGERQHHAQYRGGPLLLGAKRCIPRPVARRRFPVPLDARLLEVLCCPACRGAVRQLPNSAGVLCVACSRLYPIVDGIPVMLVEESRPPGLP